MPAVFSRPTAEVAEEDLVHLKDMEARHVQSWCLMQVDQCRSRISALRSLRDLEVQGIPEIEDGSPRVQNSALQGGVDSPGGTAISRIQECKTRIRALRFLYNSAAPINHAFPVELLMEIFTYLQPTDFNRCHGAFILRVCRLWTDVLYNTPQFWANVLALYHDISLISDRKLDRFRVALEHSFPLRLSLSLPGLAPALAKLLWSHADRISELHVDIAVSVEGLDLLLGKEMPLLDRLVITPKSSHIIFLFTGTLDSRQYAELPYSTLAPALRSIRVARPHFTASVASASLRHIELIRCWCEVCVMRQGRIFDPLLLALAECVSVETLRITKCLPGHGRWDEPPRPRCSPALYANLPRLHSLYIDDYPVNISLLLSRLIFRSRPDDSSRSTLRHTGRVKVYLSFHPYPILCLVF
ncbi:hypothetical protein L226DRAFT_567644 [Lentinus tigrinus ALCF2SS1-7]|uniref:F-box domain-containing protein n=1 Tax=Lentinus tigrinus ALCF2SS1-6 TaxID=1328759 RepID=A0A5C2RZX1_9APHY|nr:hypothetical protein L227DRAFT_614424 [Lentinus tigrinus ALCF2SS1-6]RPD79553.1 hypothetical protein L226DRAFT_567644 [Lentinus tigrinus ALCF2SS1-7]